MCRMHWMSPIIVYWARRQQPEELRSRARAYCGLAGQSPYRRRYTWRDLICCWRAFFFVRRRYCRTSLASRLGIGAVLGYLLAGIAIGPWGLGFISDVDEILHFSELGVVFLMFIIGLELNPAKLWRLRSSIFGVGAAQVMLSAAIPAVC